MSTEPTRVLLIEDNPADARLLEVTLSDLPGQPFAITVADRLERGLERLAEGDVAAVLLDLSLPDSQGMETLLAIRRAFPSVPVVVLTGLEDESVALSSLQAGAQDFLVKGRNDPELFERCLRYAIERHRADESVKRSASLLQATLDATVDGILVVDRANRIVSYNRRFVEMWSIPEPLLAGGDERRLIDFVRAQLRDPGRFVAQVEEIYGRDVGESYDLLEFKDGRVYERYSTSQILDGSIVGRVWSFHDVTERKRAVDELREAKRAAEGANRAKSEFLADLSHEIRTPLNTIIGMADLLAESPIPADQLEYVQILRRSADLMLALVSDVLDLSKIEAGRLELERIEFSLLALLDGVVPIVGGAAQAKGVELSQEIVPGTPDRLIGDPVRLRQVVVNLLANALKFTAAGSIRLRVEPDPDANHPGRILFTVADTGVGIAAEKLEHIFEQFTQADASTARRFGGSGLGLAICRRLVRRMGGRIWAESEPGRGSTFFFSVELEPADALDATVIPPTALREAHVLLVCASQSDRLLSAQALRAAGATITEAVDGPGAIAAIENADSPASFAAIVMDARLPALGGLQVLERMRGSLPSFERVLMILPAQHRKDDVSRLAKLGVGGYLVRPMEPVKLVEMLAGIVERIRAGGTAARSNARRPLRILLAEDSEDNRTLVRFFLQKTECEVECAENGELAVGKFMERSYDLVLMDLQMPMLDGLAATQAIRRWEGSHGRPATPIVALSAHALPEDVQRSIEAGCSAHLTKPIRRDRLIAAIQEYTRPGERSSV